METTDAINPMLYPDLMEDNGFVVGLFSVRIKTSDGEIESSYYDYLTKYHQAPWWSKPIQWVNDLVPTKEAGIKGNTGNNPYVLSKRQDDIANMIRDDISISVDKKTAFSRAVRISQQFFSIIILSSFF